jgi:hypothetical protein
MGPPRWGVSQRLVPRQHIVIGAIQAKSFGVQLPNPGSDNGSQGFQGEFLQAELHQLIDIADVERLRYFAVIFIVLLTVAKVLGDMLMLGAPTGDGSTPLKRLPLLWLLGAVCVD